MSDLLSNVPQRITLKDQIACVEREIRYRNRAYPRLVYTGRMTQGAADREVQVMSEVLATLQHLYVEANGKPNTP